MKDFSGIFRCWLLVKRVCLGMADAGPADHTFLHKCLRVCWTLPYSMQAHSVGLLRVASAFFTAYRAERCDTPPAPAPA